MELETGPGKAPRRTGRLNNGRGLRRMLRQRATITAPVGTSPAHAVMVGAGPPSTILPRSTPRVVDGRSPAAMTWRDRSSTPDGAVNIVRCLTFRPSRGSRASSSARSIVAALIVSNPPQTSSASRRWPCRSIASTRIGTNGRKRFPQTRSDASLHRFRLGSHRFVHRLHRYYQRL